MRDYLHQHPELVRVVVEELRTLGYTVIPPERVLPGEPGCATPVALTSTAARADEWAWPRRNESD